MTPVSFAKSTEALEFLIPAVGRCHCILPSLFFLYSNTLICTSELVLASNFKILSRIIMKEQLFHRKPLILLLFNISLYSFSTYMRLRTWLFYLMSWMCHCVFSYPDVQHMNYQHTSLGIHLFLWLMSGLEGIIHGWAFIAHEFIIASQDTVCELVTRIFSLSSPAIKPSDIDSSVLFIELIFIYFSLSFFLSFFPFVGKNLVRMLHNTQF